MLWLVLSLFLLSIEGMQQALKIVLILLRICPFLEVANVSGFFDILGPLFPTGQDGFIHPYGIQYVGLAFWFLVQCPFDLIGDPIACNSVLRQDQQQLIIQPDRLINAVFDFVTNIHVFWSKPAAYASLLQVVMQPLCKQFIFARIADKAGVVLDGAVCQGVNVGNKGVIESCTTKKGFGNFPFRPREGAGADIRRSFMSHFFQSPCRTKIDMTKYCPSYFCLTEDGTAEVGFAEVGSDEDGIAEVGTAEVGAAEVSFAEVSFVEVSFVEDGSVEVGSVEVGSVEDGTVEDGTAEDGTAEDGFAEVGTTEGGIAEDSSPEVRCYIMLRLSPSIPCISSLFEKIELMLICHIVHLLRSAHIIGKRKSICKNKWLCLPSIPDSYSLSC